MAKVGRSTGPTASLAFFAQDLVDELASPKYEQCYYSNITYEHSGFRFQIINGTLFVDHLPWHNYAGGVVSHALTPDPYNVYVPSADALHIGYLRAAVLPDSSRSEVPLCTGGDSALHDSPIVKSLRLIYAATE